MPRSLDLKSPAKLNLMLHITGQRADGYHELQSVFQFISLFDSLRFVVNDHARIQRIAGNDKVPAGDDLVVRAAQLLQQQTGCDQGADISIQKNIPMGGGLGGGSSDAATTLMALNHLWQTGLSRSELQQLGLQLGADIPIFIFGKSAWAEGVGERLSEIELPEPWYLVIDPQIFVSTGQIFSSKHLTRDCHPIKIRAFLEGEGQNVCEPVACELYPEIRQALDWLNPHSPARMTGTGACVFAAFDSAEQANRVKSRLPANWQGYVARGLNTNPVATACFEAAL